MAGNTQTPPDDPLGAFCTDNHVALTHTADGILSGKQFAVKDVFDIAGTCSGFGNPDWLATHPPAASTASVIEVLLNAGGDMIGRTLSDELTYSLTGENAHYGTPINPAAPERIPGGSSNGSASAVAGELVDFALGTDCGGSVRLPASYCGIIGIRPSHNRVAVDGVIPFAPSFDVVGWFTRDAGLCEIVGALLLNEAATPALPTRLLVADDALAMVAPATRAAFELALAPVTGLLGAPAGLTVSSAGLNAWFEVFRVVQGSEIWRNRREWIETVKPNIGAGVRERLDWAATLGAAQIDPAVRQHQAIRGEIDRLLAPGDVLCLPTSPRAAPLKSEPATTIENEYRVQAMRLLCIAGLGGLPQVSLPLATLDGLPLGLSLIGPTGSDMQLLALARALCEPQDRGR